MRKRGLTSHIERSHLGHAFWWSCGDCDHHVMCRNDMIDHGIDNKHLSEGTAAEELFEAILDKSYQRSTCEEDVTSDEETEPQKESPKVPDETKERNGPEAVESRGESSQGQTEAVPICMPWRQPKREVEVIDVEERETPKENGGKVLQKGKRKKVAMQKRKAMTNGEGSRAVAQKRRSVPKRRKVKKGAKVWCRMCEKFLYCYNVYNSIISHLYSRHTDLEEHWQCSSCGMGMRRKGNLKRHIRSKHKGTGRPVWVVRDWQQFKRDVEQISDRCFPEIRLSEIGWNVTSY